MKIRLLRILSAALLATALGLPIAASSPVEARADTNECTPGAESKIPGPPPAFAQMQLPDASQRPSGKGITVAVVDSGIDATHPLLREVIDLDSGVTFVDSDEPDPFLDAEGHGTAVAGVIAAQPSEEFGSLGVAPDVRLVSIRVYQSSDDSARNSGLGPTPSKIAAGIRQAVAQGADIIAVPLSDPTDHERLEEATKHASSRGSLVIASSGNRLTTNAKEDSPRYPAAYDGVLSVTAIDPDGDPTSATIHGDHIDVAAPGQDVLTTAALAGDCLYASDAPSTSFATAYVAGVAALVAEQYPDEGPQEWAYRLMVTADRPDPDSSNTMTGWGAIRPEAALTLNMNVPLRGPVNPLTGTTRSPLDRPQEHLEQITTPTVDRTPYIVFSVIAGGLILTLGLGAYLRRSPQVPHEPEPDTTATDAKQEEKQS